MTETNKESGADEFFSDARTTSSSGGVEQLGGNYRDYLLDVEDPKIAQYRGQGYEHYSSQRTAPAFVQELLSSWERLYQEPFRGVTIDGFPREDLYQLPAAGTSDPSLRVAAQHVLEVLTPDERLRYCYGIEAQEWRAWSNPEFVIHRVGLRLEDLTDEKIEAILNLIRSCLSPEGYGRVRELMSLNGLLGDLTDLQTIMNERSYWVSMFGTPSDDAPWGWQLFGHHIAINFIAVGGRHVIAPVFLGAEPAVIDDGRPGVFAAREAAAIALASSLSPSQRAEAVVFDSVLDPAMPTDRLHPADERHVAGAFRDNRVIPYEGILVSSLDQLQRQLLRNIIADFLVLLAESQREVTLSDVEAHFDETWFAWYGATDGTQPFYFRIHSPVIIAELDHHAGVWLANQLPARFHVHTTLRLPNGNDYARAYISEWSQNATLPSDNRKTFKTEEP